MRDQDYQVTLDNAVNVHRQCATFVSKFRKRLNCRREVYENMTLSPAAMDACRCCPPCADVSYDSSYSLSTLPPLTPEYVTFYHPLYHFVTTLSPERKRLLGVTDYDKKTVLSDGSVFVTCTGVQW